MDNKLSQEEIDELIRVLKAAEHGDRDNINGDFIIELLTDKLLFLENKKRELLMTIESDYQPKIDSLKKAISILKLK